jgi:REP element-mobilizing transposase RayT
LKYPIAYFITWTTYGTWLHGDQRGSFDAEGNYIPPDSNLKAAAESAMTEGAVVLTDEQRRILDARLVELCRLGNWQLHARNVRTCHVHAVVSAALDGKVLRARLKAGCAMSLSEHAGLLSNGKDGAKKWFTQKGNIEEIWTEKHLLESIHYVSECQ